MTFFYLKKPPEAYWNVNIGQMEMKQISLKKMNSSAKIEETE